VVGWYGLTHLPDCAGPRCPPSYWPLQTPVLIGLAIAQLSQYGWIRQVERRCGISFRAPAGALGAYTWYVRRPGVTAAAAAAALARATRGGVGRPVAGRIFVTMLVSVPFFLAVIALGLLSAWLPTQWMAA
jgi:hypothetical protein